MNYLPLILQIQKEQLQNPLRRYKKVREFYREGMEENCIFHNLFAFPNPDRRSSHEPFPKSLFPKFTPARHYYFTIPSHDKIVPITIEIAVKICEKNRVEEKKIPKGFEWNHFYAVSPEIVTQLTCLEKLDEAWNKQWIEITPEWMLKELEEFNDPKNF